MSIQTPSRADCHEMLQEQGYVSVPFNIDGSDIDPLFREFRDFLDLCDEPGGNRFRDALAYTPDNRQTGGDYFVTRRRIGELNLHAVNQIPSTEDKDVAHIGPCSIDRAFERLGGEMPKVMHVFLNSCVELHEASKSAVRPVLRAYELESVMLARNEKEDQHVVRLLRYLGTSAATLADLHFDRSALTLAAWESHPGLIGAPGNNAQRQNSDIYELDEAAVRAHNTPIEHVSGEAKVFLGAGYNRLPNEIYDVNNRLPLLLHGVNNVKTEEERDAVVVFMHPPAYTAGYQVPARHETGLEDVRDHILRRMPVHDAVG